jgi:multidrug efflux pump subunit AcrA (membrane-fusion protein)
VKYYLSRIKLDRALEGLRPGMSAEVEITTETRSMVTAVPPGAITTSDGQDVCYVVRPEGYERRPVTIGLRTVNMFEVTEGLQTGDQVLLEPNEVFQAAVVAGRDFVPSTTAMQ